MEDHSYAEQKTRLLQARLSENAETIKDLRHERSLLATDHKNLQQRFAEVTEVSQMQSGARDAVLNTILSSEQPLPKLIMLPGKRTMITTDTNLTCI